MAGDATQVGSLYYDLDLDSSKFKAGSQQATEATDTLKSKMGEITNASDIYAGAFAAAGAAIGAAAIKIGVDAVHEYSLSQDALTRLTQGLSNVGEGSAANVKAIQDQADALQKITKFSNDQIISADGMLTTFKLQRTTIEQLNPSLLDMAEGLRDVNGNTLGLDEAAKLMGKVMGNAAGGVDGLATALRRQGIIMTQAQKDIFTTGTEAQRAATLTQIMNDNFGGFAKAGGADFSGRIIEIQHQYDDFIKLLGKSIVDTLTPLVAKFSTWFDKMGGAQGVLDHLKRAVIDVANYIKMHKDQVIILAAALAGPLVLAVGSLLLAFGGFILTLLPVFLVFGGMALLTERLVEHFGGLNKTVGDLKTIFHLLYDTFTGGDPTISASEANFAGLSKVLSDLQGIVLYEIVPAVQKFGQESIVVFNSYIKPAFEGIWMIIKDMVWPALQALWNTVKTQLFPALQELWGVLKPMLIPALEIIGGIVGVIIIGAFVSFLVILQTVINLVRLFVGVLADVIDGMAHWIKGLKEIFSGEFTKGFGDLGQGLVDTFLKPFKTAFDWLTSSFKGLVDGIGKSVGGAADTLHNLHVPGFATGVQDFAGGLANINERGGELVNLPSGATVVPADKSAQLMNGGGLGGGGTININVGAFMGNQADAKAFAELITRYQSRYNRQLGV